MTAIMTEREKEERRRVRKKKKHRGEREGKEWKDKEVIKKK